MHWSKCGQIQRKYHGQVRFTWNTKKIANMSTRLYHLGHMDYNMLIICNWSVSIRSSMISLVNFDDGNASIDMRNDILLLL